MTLYDARLNRLVDLLESIVTEVAATRVDAKAHDTQRRRIRDLQHAGLTDVRLGLRGQFDAATHGSPKGRHAKCLDRHPDLEGPERATKLQTPVAEIRVIGTPLRVLQVLRMDRERGLELAHILHHQASHLEGLEEPFVCVHGDRVRSLHALEQALAMLAKHREAAVRGVDVVPDALGFAVVRHGVQRVDCSGVGRTGVSAHGDRSKPGGTILIDHPGEVVHVQTKVLVALHLPHTLRSNPDDGRSAAQRSVALITHVDGGALRGTRIFPGHDEGIQTGGGPSAGEDSPGGLGGGDPVAEPIEHDHFQLAGSTSSEPRSLKNVVPGSHEVREHSRPSRRRGYEREEARMVDTPRHGQDLRRSALEHLLSASPLLWGILPHDELEFRA